MSALIVIVVIGLIPAMLVKAGQWRRARKARRAGKDRAGRWLALMLLLGLIGSARR